MEDMDERDEELSSITAIFPELSIDPVHPHVATLELDVKPPQPVHIIWRDAEKHEDPPVEPSDVVMVKDGQDSVEFLPPLSVRIGLPDGYPDSKPPEVSISTSPAWLDGKEIDRAAQQARLLWDDYGHTQVLFAYIDWLQTEIESLFGAKQPLELPHHIRQQVLNLAALKSRQEFEKGSYHCGICLDPKPGSACYKLQSCGHVFCTACLQDFYSTAIVQGEVDTVKCLDPDCGKVGLSLAQRRAKRDRTLHPRELLAIPLTTLDVQRYVNLKLKRRIETDKMSVFCPRQWCQAPARSAKFAKFLTTSSDLAQYPDSDSDEEDVAQEVVTPTKDSHTADNRLAICSACEYAFCRNCHRSWHGEHVICRHRTTVEKISPEDQASEDWIRMYTSPCPTCDTPCQKLFGCNHMNCSQCKTHFCYLCSAWLKPGDPYKHFNEKGRGCFQRLWDLEEGDRGDLNAAGGVEFGGARGFEAAHVQHMANGNPAEQDEARAAAAPAVLGGGDDDPRAARERRGIQRFLEMARNDIEDEWDSDDLEEDLVEQLVLLERGR